MERELLRRLRGKTLADPTALQCPKFPRRCLHQGCFNVNLGLLGLSGAQDRVLEGLEQLWGGGGAFRVEGVRLRVGGARPLLQAVGMVQALGEPCK